MSPPEIAAPAQLSNSDAAAALKAAAILDNTESVRHILQKYRIDLEDQGSALCLAIDQYHTDIPRLLIEKIASHVTPADNPPNPLLTKIWNKACESAINAQHIESLALLIAAPAMKFVNIESLAIKSAQSGNVVILKILTGLGRPEMKTQGLLGRMLIEAAGRGRRHFVEALLGMGVTVKHTQDGPLVAASQAGRTKVVQCLAEHWLAQHCSDGQWNAAREAAKTSGTSMIFPPGMKILVEKDPVFARAFEVAVLKGSKRCNTTATAQYLLDIGVNPFLNGSDCLLIAVEKDRYEYLDMMLTRAPAPPKILNEALRKAAALKKDTYVERLIREGADQVNQALRLSTVSNIDHMTADSCLLHGANPNLEGGMPLACAIAGESVEMVQTLLEYGADPLLPHPESPGKTLFDMAISQIDRSFESGMIVTKLARAVAERLNSTTQAETPAQQAAAEQAEVPQTNSAPQARATHRPR